MKFREKDNIEKTDNETLPKRKRLFIYFIVVDGKI